MRAHIKDVFKNKSTPHKLHIIDHGDPDTGGKCSDATATELVQDIYDSGMENLSSSKVRLDICGAGMHNTGTPALAYDIVQSLKQYKLFGPNCKIEVAGPHLKYFYDTVTNIFVSELLTKASPGLPHTHKRSFR